MRWLSRNAESVEAGAAVITALVAVAALVGVKFQLDEADRIQKTQSAREAYRAHLTLAATLPQFSQPTDACGLMASDKAGAYAAFVDQLLYSAEQMLAVSDGWDETFLTQLEAHGAYICYENGPTGETDETKRLLQLFRSERCAAQPACS